MSVADQPAADQIDIDRLMGIDESCGQCDGSGWLAGCFEDTCCGADCDPDDAELCCAPTRCDLCNPRKGTD